MRCEKGIEKSGSRECSGPFCEPDLFDAARIAQNFTEQELNERIAKVKERLDQKPESCEVQAGYNQLMQAARVKGMPRAQKN